MLRSLCHRIDPVCVFFSAWCAESGDVADADAAEEDLESKALISTD